MGAALVRRISLPSPYDESHPLMKADGTYMPTLYESKLITSIRNYSFGVVISIIFSIILTALNTEIGSDHTFLIVSISQFIQVCATLFITPNSTKVRSYRWVVGLRLVLEFFLVLVLARVFALIQVYNLSCDLRESAFEGGSKGLEFCGSELTLMSLIVNLFYDFPTIVQIHLVRQLQHSYERHLIEEALLGFAMTNTERKSRSSIQQSNMV